MNKINDFYIFPAVIEKSEPNESDPSAEGVGLYFPDVPGTAVLAPDAHTAVKEAKQMLIDILLDYENRNIDIPNASEPENIELYNKSDMIVFVEVFLPPYRDAAANRSVQINCTVPQWVKDAGKNANLNFSLLLQKSVKDALDIK